MPELDVALSEWLKPFVEKVGHKKQRQMCPVYVSGLIEPGLPPEKWFSLK